MAKEVQEEHFQISRTPHSHFLRTGRFYISHQRDVGPAHDRPGGPEMPYQWCGNAFQCCTSRALLNYLLQDEHDYTTLMTIILRIRTYVLLYL